MPNTSNTSTPIKGMISDLHSFNTDPTTYSFALNAMVEDFWFGNTNFLSNEPSNQCSVAFPPNYKVVGYVPIIEQNRTIYFLHNPLTGRSQIGEVLNCIPEDNTDKIKQTYCNNCPEYVGEENTPLEKQQEICYCDYRLIIDSDCLNFDINYPVDIEYKITNCSLNLYFTDGINERRFIYFDYEDNDITKPIYLQDRFKVEIGTQEPPCDAPIYSDELDCNKIKYHPDYERPCVEFIDFVNGGNLKAGSYQVLVAYADVYGNPISAYFPGTQIIPLFENEITFDTDYQTNKALHFKINNLKTTGLFQYYNIVIAQTISNFTTFVFVGTFSTTRTDYVYTGFEKTLTTLTAQEVFFERPFYKTATGVTKANNYLFFTGVEEYKLLNLQQVANKVKLGWQTVALTEKAYRDPRNSFFYRTYHRDEVYSVGIIFEFDNGRETCVFHIPGREPNATDLEVICSSNDLIIDETCDPLERCNGSQDPDCKLRWQVYNTGTVTGTPHEYSQNCDDQNCWEYGEFAYWESTERYPNVPEIWGELCGQCIRHHKMPDSCVTHIHDGLNGNKGFNENNYIFPIGIRVDHQSVIDALDQAVLDQLITQEDRDSIKSYRIVRGNRVGNKSIQAKGLIFNMFQYDKYNQTYYYPNYAYNDLGTDAYIGDATLSPANRFTFHSPDVHFTNSSLGSILKVETEEYGQSEGYYTYSDCQAKQRFLSVFAQTLAFGLGLAAAISATGEKSCKVITYMSDYITDDQEVYPNYVYNWAFGGVLGTGVGSGTGTTTPGLQMTQDTERHNTEPYTMYDPVFGTTIPGPPGAQEEITTCTGESYQVFNDPTFLGGIFAFSSIIIQRTMLGILEMNRILDTIRVLIPKKNYSMQYNSVGKYNNYRCVLPGNKNRQVLKYAYLTPDIQNVDEPATPSSTTFDTIKINNWDRESSVYVRIDGTLDNPITVDDSKVSMNEQFGENSLDRLDEVFYRTISSYYVSLKDDILNQYGQICNIDYLETNGCSFQLDEAYTECHPRVFGGDIFISRFGLKRKMPFFLQTACKLPDETDILYSELGNAGTPIYYFNTPQPLLDRVDNILTIIPDVVASWFDNSILSLVNDNRRNFEVRQDAVLPLFYQNGAVSLFNYGIPYFLVESDVNVDLRHGQNNLDKDFYPHNKDLKRWLEEGNVPITTDNTYFYNSDYSKQNHESSICISCILDPKDLICQSTNYNRLIYSGQTDTENKNDNWLIFKANDFYDFPLTLGKLITADGIENDKVLVRLEKGTQIFNAYDTLQATGANIQVGTGGIFQSRPRDIAITDLGYAGTQHKDILHTEYGHIWADAMRGQVFNLSTGGNGIEEISKNGMKSWFKENLPFTIKKHFPNVDIDNNLNGIGLHYGYDRRFNRFLITKLDYKPIDPNIQYNEQTKTFYIVENNINKTIQLWNPKYFCDKSWTVSYNFYNNSWTSFHSYKPQFYVEHINTFDSSTVNKTVINGALGKVQKLYTHNFSNKSFQVFYGKLEPFIVEVQTKQDLSNHTLNSVEYYLDVIRYHNEFDTFYNRTKTFSKAIVYNERQTSGLLHLIPAEPNNLTQMRQYPKRVNDGYEIITTNSENMWRFNSFWDAARSQTNNLPIFNYDCNNVNKQLNPLALNYDKPDIHKQMIRSRMCKVRFIQDIESNYKYIFIFSQNNQKQSFR